MRRQANVAVNVPTLIVRLSLIWDAAGGAIVNVSSGSALQGLPWIYAISKGALNSMQARAWPNYTPMLFVEGWRGRKGRRYFLQISFASFNIHWLADFPFPFHQ
jgi:hypothetical protein